MSAPFAFAPLAAGVVEEEPEEGRAGTGGVDVVPFPKTKKESKK
jgi:hypothetical protein